MIPSTERGAKLATYGDDSGLGNSSVFLNAIVIKIFTLLLTIWIA